MSRKKGAALVLAEQKVQVVLSVLSGELSVAEAARSYGVSTLTVSRWRERFVQAGKAGLEHNPMPGPNGKAGSPEVRRLRAENEQRKLCFRGQIYQTAFGGDDPLLRHVRTRVRSPQTNGVVERFFGTLKYEFLYRAEIADGDALAVEVQRFRQLYNTIRPHQALGDRTPLQSYRGLP